MDKGLSSFQKWLAPILVLTTLSLVTCGPDAHGAYEQPIPASAGSATELAWPTRIPGPQTLPPSEAEVRNALRRVFGSALEIEDHAQPLAGDFNGDDSEDLIVAVKPLREKLAELNDPVANWIVEDPRHAYVPEYKAVVVPPPVPKPQAIRPGETLLAVVHGYGASGWRDPMARQTYLLRGVAGTSLQVGEPSSALLQEFGLFPSRRNVITEKLGDAHGTLYWTGATYAWHTEK